MTRYAQGTDVPVSRSQEEVERTLVRFGCQQRAWMRDDAKPMIALAFTRKGLSYRMVMPLDKSGGERETRRRMRVVLLWLKAQCEMVDTGLMSFEDAFLPHAALPDGRTVAQAFQPQVQAMLTEGRMPSLTLSLPQGEGRRPA